MNSASTDPTIPETIIPWYFTDLQDDRVQGYTLARHIYTELGLKRVAILRVNDRYGRFGVLKFRDASRRLGHPVVIEQKFMPGDTDFRRQLQVIEDSRVDAIVLWTDIGPAAIILQQMQRTRDEAARVRQPPHHRRRTRQTRRPRRRRLRSGLSLRSQPHRPALAATSPPATKRASTRSPITSPPSPTTPCRFLLDAICRAGLNKGRIRDALTATQTYKGVTGDMVFDPNCKNIAPLFLAHVHDGTIDYRRITMEKPYARVGEDGVQYAGPPLPDEQTSCAKIGVFGPHADELVRSPEIQCAC